MECDGGDALFTHRLCTSDTNLLASAAGIVEFHSTNYVGKCLNYKQMSNEKYLTGAGGLRVESN